MAPRRRTRKMLRPMTSRVLSERRGDAVLVTLNAPERRNAIDQEMVDGLHAVLDELADDDTVAAIVITGAGEKAFAAGADIAQLRDRTSKDAMKAINSGIFNRIEEFAVPVIAAVKGYALGGGCELAIACDLRVIGESAKMGQPEVKLGIIPAAGGTYRLPRLIGLGLARAAEPDQARQAVGAAGCGDDAELDLGLAHLGRLTDHAQVARDRELTAAAERVALDRGDHRRRELLDPVEDPAVDRLHRGARHDQLVPREARQGPADPQRWTPEPHC